MKICIFGASFVKPKGGLFVGHARYALDAARSLSEKGYDIKIITNVPDQTYQIPNDLSIYPINDELYFAGKISLRRAPRNFLSLLHFIYLLKKVDPDIIHGYGEIGTGLILALSKFLLRKPTIITMTRPSLFVKSPKFLLSMLSYLDFVIFTSEFSKKELHSIPSKKKISLKHGVQNSFIHPNPCEVDWGVDKGKTILFWRDATYEGGVDTVLNAFNKVLKEVPDAYLILAIRHWDQTFKQKTSNLAENNRVRVLSYPYPKGISIVDIISSSAIVVLPFRVNSMEPPLSLLETMAMGKTVITSNIGANIEIVNNLKNGILIDPDEPAELAEAIIYLLSNPAERKKIGKRAREYIIKNYTWGGYIKEITPVYEELNRS